MNTETLLPKLKQIRSAGIILGAAGIALALFGSFGNHQQFFISYLFSYLFWLGIALGSLVISMIHYLTGGRWGSVTRRFHEASFMTLPVMAVFFIPIILGIKDLYRWAQPGIIAADKALQSKSAYLNPAAFTIRAIVFFAIWLTIAFSLRRWSLQQDQTSGVAPLRKMRTLSGPGVAIYTLTTTFAYIDWVMSLEPDWYSTMFPVIICIGQILSAFAFSTIMLVILKKYSPIREAATTTQFHQLGNLLLAFVMFWTYIVFGQFLINWSGNTPKEILWHQHRIAGSWKDIVAILVIFHFFIPFFVLLFRNSKQNPAFLAVMAAIVFTAQVIAVFWLITPSVYQVGLHVSWLDFAAFFGIGGVWLATFATNLQRHPVIARNDPRLEAAS